MHSEDIVFVRADWARFAPYAAEHYRNNKIILDSFLEDHLQKANHYRMEYSGETVGYFAIANQSTLVFFHVCDAYARFGQALFARAKRYENVTNAMVPTGDEFFLSHAADAFTRLEKQAYFAVYPKLAPQVQLCPLTLRLLDVAADAALLKKAGDFFDDDIEKIKAGGGGRIYAAEAEGKTVGFGIMDPSVLVNYASIGMYVLEEYRRKGYAGSILSRLSQMAREQNLQAVSGCWYYNHNSKKSMESAGGYTKTRLLRFYF